MGPVLTSVLQFSAAPAGSISNNNEYLSSRTGSVGRASRSSSAWGSEPRGNSASHEVAISSRPGRSPLWPPGPAVSATDSSPTRLLSAGLSCIPPGCSSETACKAEAGRPALPVSLIPTPPTGYTAQPSVWERGGFTHGQGTVVASWGGLSKAGDHSLQVGFWERVCESLLTGSGVCVTGLSELLPEGGTEGQTPPSAGRMAGWNLQELWAPQPRTAGNTSHRGPGRGIDADAPGLRRQGGAQRPSVP